MLKITVPKTTLWDESRECFIPVKEQELQLEHSLVSISKWEAKHHKPFLSKDAKTNEESVDYIRCMTLTQNVDPNVYTALTAENMKAVEQYINDPMTATQVRKKTGRSSGNKMITSELIYYWMTALHIPFECQKWHLSRLLTLIEVTNIEGQPAKKMSQREIMQQNAELNAKRRQALKSKG